VDLIATTQSIDHVEMVLGGVNVLRQAFATGFTAVQASFQPEMCSPGHPDEVFHRMVNIVR